MMEKCKNIGVNIPPANEAGGIYSRVVFDGDLAYLSGQTTKRNGVVMYAGKLGDTITIADGRQAARLCVINCLALIQDLCGGLINVERFLKMTGYVNSMPSFHRQPEVVDGASELLFEIFNDKGLPARSAVGVSSLPGNACCEIELLVKLKININ